MSVYRYKAVSASGEILEGEVEAATRASVVKQLQDQGHVPIRAEEIAAKRARGERRLSLARRRKLGPREVSVLTLELAGLLEAGITLDRALAILARISETPNARQTLSALHEKVRRGSSLADAMRAEGAVFSRFYVNLVRAGEAGGALEATLSRLATFLDNAQKLRSELLSATIYPLILIALALASIALILGYVVPRFADLFEGAGAVLPWPTRVVIFLGELLQHYGLGVVVALALGAWLAQRLWRQPRWRNWLDARLLGLPLAGDLIVHRDTAGFARALGTLLASGVPLLEAMRVAAEVVSNRVLGRALAEVAERTRDGQGLARPLIASGVFPPLAGHMLLVGEETGKLESMLLKLADLYEREVQTTLRRLVVVLEPVLILGLGLVVAAIIFSILSAVLSVNELALT